VYLQAVYKVWARYYDDFNRWFSNWKGIRQAETALEAALTAHVTPEVRILDLGCGTGSNADRIVRLDLPFQAYLGADLSEHMLTAARKKHTDRPDMRFELIRLDRDELPDGEYDVVLATWVFSHLQEPERLVERIVSRLKPGGVLLATFKAERNWLIDTLLWPFYKSYDAVPVRRSSVAKFPHLVRMDRYWGGWATFIVCQRPVETVATPQVIHEAAPIEYPNRLSVQEQYS
jgi:ubiquinone/menaquinone biosynthesis C-methylase UbiE